MNNSKLKNIVGECHFNHEQRTTGETDLDIVNQKKKKMRREFDVYFSFICI